MSNVRIVVGGYVKDMADTRVSVGGYIKKTDTLLDSITQVIKKVWSGFDPNIPGTWTFSLRAEQGGGSGVSTPYYTLFTRAKANEAIANGYTHITFTVSAQLYNTAGDMQQHVTVVACSSAPENYSWSIDVLQEWYGSHSYSTVSATVSWPLSRMSAVTYATAFGFQVGIYSADYYYELSNGRVTNVHFT